MKLSNREKSAFILGMAMAYLGKRRPRNSKLKKQWERYGISAHQALTGGCYNIHDAFAIQNLADSELKTVTIQGEEQLNEF